MTRLQTLTTYTGVYPNRAVQDDNARALAVFNFLEWAGGSLVTDINTNFISKLNTLSGEIQTAAEQVAEDKNTASAAANIAASAADYKGIWSTLTGILNTPASLGHNGAIWMLNINLADVTASEPSDENADWTKLGISQADLDAKLNLAQAQAIALCF